MPAAAFFVPVFGRPPWFFEWAIVCVHGAATLATDGILGPATWKTYQFWSGNKLPGDMKNICGFTLTGSTIGKWVDGVAGKWTITMLQVMLNRSYAGSGKLLSK